MRIFGPFLVLLAFSLPADAAGISKQLTDQKQVRWDGYSLDDLGTDVYAASNENLGGTNPLFEWQLDSWNAATGVGSVLAAVPKGAHTDRDAVSDDGQWIAFRSRGDLTGGNPDGSVELFLMKTDGTQTRQLTSAPGNGGSVLFAALAGSGNRVVFSADTDPLGTNPSRVPQLFVVNADGTGLAQLTTTTSTSGFYASISDDGTRIAFHHAGNLTGGNPDLKWEIFTILATGSGLTQLTTTPGTSATQGAWNPRLSGNGLRIAFHSAETISGLNTSGTERIWTIDWAGTNLRTVSPNLFPSVSPSITDDGTTVVYASTEVAIGNADGSFEIFRVQFDGTGKTRLTSTTAPSGCFGPEISGGGGRIAFAVSGPIGTFNTDGGPALMVMDSNGGTLRLLLEGRGERDTFPDMTPDATRIVFDSGRDPFGTNSLRRQQLFRMQTDGTGLVQITSFADGDVWHPRVSDDGQWIAFTSNANPTGANPSHLYEPFVVRSDGTGLRQLTPTGTAGGGAQGTPAIAGNASWVAFQSIGNPTGGNPDGSAELFRVRPDGTGLMQLTSDDSPIYKLPRIDASGTWIVYQSLVAGPSGFRISRIRTDGTGLETITNFASYQPDISAAGDRIAFVSDADPLGTNPDGGDEVFVWDAAGAVLRQATSLPGGSMGRVRLSRDGAYVAFATTAPVFEPNPAEHFVPYRVEVATGAIERLGGIETTIPEGSDRYGGFVASDQTGRRFAFMTELDPVGRNPDLSTEIFFLDLALTPKISVSRSSPTLVSWDPDPHAVRYDVVRGNVASLAIAGSTVDLGPVVCLADDLSGLSIADGVDPAPGQAYFYVRRGTQGAADGPGSYGQGTGNRERVPGSGGCAP